LAQRFNHPFSSTFHDQNCEVEEKLKKKTKKKQRDRDLKRKKQNVALILQSGDLLKFSAGFLGEIQGKNHLLCLRV
jgi:hypothetical protein